MRGILINPWDRTITEVEVPEGDYRAIYPLLSQPDHPERPGHGVDCYGIVGLGNDPSGNDVSMFVDDHGLLFEGIPLFEFVDGSQHIPGRGLILASDGEGETIGTTLPLAAVQRTVVWLDVETTGDVAPSTELRGEEAKAYLLKAGGLSAVLADDKDPFVILGGQGITRPRAQS